jgi:hypothetical protein
MARDYSIDPAGVMVRYLYSLVKGVNLPDYHRWLDYYGKEGQFKTARPFSEPGG